MDVKTRKEAVRTLRKARKLIEKPERWCKGAYTRFNERTLKTEAYCPLGALFASGSVHSRGWDCLDMLTPDGHVPTFNDHPDTTHADVLALFEWAIGLAESGLDAEVL